jgi:hypothetical protein
LKKDSLALPPNGWFARSADGRLLAWSATVDGHRADYVDSPAYLYADGRGRFTRFEIAACDGQIVAHKRADGTREVIPIGRCESFGVGLDGRAASAMALDKERRELGPVGTRLSRGLVYVTPVSNAFSYLLKPGEAPAVALRCPREEVIPCETVTVTGRQPHTFTVPKTARPGARLWQQFEEGWMDFTVVALADTRLSVTDKLRLELTARVPQPTRAQVTLDGQTQSLDLSPDRPATLDFPFTKPDQELTRPLPLRIVAGDFNLEEQWRLNAKRSLVQVAPMPDKLTSGQCFRNKPETGLDGASGAQSHPETMSCGETSKRGLFMHPPYLGGVGYAFALYEPVTLPREPRAVFRCDIGKRDGSDRGDGILFRVLVLPADGKETVGAEKQWAEHAWTSLEADLSRWAGQTIRIKLVADVGPADNSGGDWACWANLRLESTEPVMQLSVQR